MATIPAHATWFLVPAGTPASRCRGTARGGSCSADIYFAENPKTGRLVPIDCDVPGGKRPGPALDPNQGDIFTGPAVEPEHGKGVSHYLTCCDADLFAKGSR
jgi:hypothetical protein